MRLLILSQYYPPETGAPQNRLHGLAKQLIGLGAEIEVLTGMPNYPSYEIFEAYRGKRYMKEAIEGITVHRAYIYVSKRKSLVARLLNYFSFVLSAWYFGLTKLGHFDMILCESPPLFLGFTAVMLKRRKKAKLVFNVSDLWPESAVKLGLVTDKYMVGLSRKLEEWIYRNADFISGQTQGIVKNIHTRFPQKPIFWLRNGVDVAEMSGYVHTKTWRHKVGYQPQQLIVYFGGLIGYAQGLEVILKAAERLKTYPDIQFAIVGEGPEKAKLLSLKSELGLENVRFFDGVSKSEIKGIIADADISIIPLRKIDLFLGAIPSKIFEILFLKKPVLLGVAGEAKELFIDEGKAGLFFEPENDNMLADCVLYLYNNKEQIKQFAENGYSYVKTNFDREKIASDYYQYLMQS
jgi:glycosyltransferase involved in cell wall biosynthesis